MITPEQKQAWREEYIDELRAISQERPDLGDYQELLDKSDINDRIFMFFLDAFVPSLNAFGYYLQNNPLDDDPEGEPYPVSEEIVLTRSELFEYLSGMCHYGREKVLSKLTNDKQLLLAIQNDDEELFLNATKEDDPILARICLEVGYANHVLILLRDMLSFVAEAMDYAMSDEEEETRDDDEMPAFLQEKKDSIEQSSEVVIPGVKDQFNQIIEQLTSLIPLVSQFKLAKEADFIYASDCVMFYLFYQLISSLESDERGFIFHPIENTEFTDVLDDIKQVLYLTYGFTGGGRYELDNLEELDRKKAGLPSEVFATIEDPLPVLMNSFATNNNPQSN